MSLSPSQALLLPRTSHLSHDVLKFHFIKTFLVQQGSQFILVILNSRKDLQNIIRFQHWGDTTGIQVEQSAGFTGGWCRAMQTEPLSIAWPQGQGIIDRGCTYWCQCAQFGSLGQPSGMLCAPRSHIPCFVCKSQAKASQGLSKTIPKFKTISPNQILSIKASPL